MLIQPRLGTPAQTFAQTVTDRGGTRLAPSGLVKPAPFVPGPVSFSGSGLTTTATRPASPSPMPVTQSQIRAQLPGPFLGVSPSGVAELPPTPAEPLAPVGENNMGWLQGLGGIAGGVIGLATGGISGAISGFQAGEHAFGGSGGTVKPNLPALTAGGGSTGGYNLPFPVSGPGGIPLPGYNPGTAVARVHGHYTKGTRRNPSHWSNRRRPRMNPMNVHAGRRAITRIRAAEKLFHRFLSVSHPGHTGRVKMKRLKSGSR